MSNFGLFAEEEFEDSALRMLKIRGGMPADLLKILLTSVVLIYYND